MTADLREHLEELVKHPGWLWLCEEARKEWEHPLAHIMNAVGDRDDAMALNKLRQVLAAKAAVEAMLAKPEARIRVLREAEEARAGHPDYSRRGTL